MSTLRIALGWASMRWSQRWPMRAVLQRIFSKADAIELPDYELIWRKWSKATQKSPS